MAAGGRDAVDVADGYERLAARGYGYGPAFQGLTAMWRRGDELFAEVTLPEAAGGVSGFGVHPVLLDAALHAAVVATDTRPPSCCCRSPGRVCRCMRRGRRRCGRGSRRRVPSAVSMELADGLGLPVLSVASMVARPVTDQQLRRRCRARARTGSSRWSGRRRAGSRRPAETPAYEVFESVAAEGDPVTGSYERTHPALAAVQSWLTERDSGVLVVSTRGAMGLPGEDVTDLAGAAVWGLVRSAQTEHPGRIVLVDSDAPLDDAAIAAVLAVGEPQVLVRGETVYTARVHGSRARRRPTGAAR